MTVLCHSGSAIRFTNIGPKTQELIVVLAKLALLLEGDGERHLSAWMLHEIDCS